MTHQPTPPDEPNRSDHPSDPSPASPATQPAGAVEPGRRRRQLSLTTRLVVTVVCLLAVVAMALSTVAALGLRSHLTGEVDQNLSRIIDLPNGRGGPSHQDGPGRGPDLGNQAPETLLAFENVGEVRASGFASDIALTTPQLDQVNTAAGTSPTTVEVSGIGSYRVVQGELRGIPIVVGLPMADVDEAVTNLVLRVAGLSLVGVLAAGLVGRVLVRRQLAPLREVAATAHRVAETPMSSGAVAPVDRVPEDLIASGVEVGQVGQALNTLLDHVEASLGARHKSEQQVRQFVADASHELRTPLATVRGYSELARRNPEDTEAARTALDKVEQESARMSALVEDLLLLARLDQGRPLESVPVDLRALAVEAVVDARVIAPQHHWQLDLDPEHGEVLGDATRLHQVVSNLVTNAWRHTPAGTTVTLGVHRDGPGVRLLVADDGPGIEAALLPRVFERFTRGDRARTRGRGTTANGTGLGLSTVRAIVTSHGGTVEVASDPTGTRFIVLLPAAPPHTSDPVL